MNKATFMKGKVGLGDKIPATFSVRVNYIKRSNGLLLLRPIEAQISG